MKFLNVYVCSVCNPDDLTVNVYSCRTANMGDTTVPRPWTLSPSGVVNPVSPDRKPFYAITDYYDAYFEAAVPPDSELTRRVAQLVGYCRPTDTGYAKYICSSKGVRYGKCSTSDCSVCQWTDISSVRKTQQPKNKTKTRNQRRLFCFFAAGTATKDLLFIPCVLRSCTGTRHCHSAGRRAAVHRVGRCKFSLCHKLNFSGKNSDVSLLGNQLSVSLSAKQNPFLEKPVLSRIRRLHDRIYHQS